MLPRCYSVSITAGGGWLLQAWAIHISDSFPTAHMFNFTQQQALFLPYLPSKAKPTLVGMNTEVTLRKSNIIWTAVDSLLFIRNFNKGQRKKAAVQQRASPALAQLLHKMRNFQNEKVNITLYSRKEVSWEDVSSQSLEIANLTLMKCKHPPTLWIQKLGFSCDSFLVELLCPYYPQGKKLQMLDRPPAAVNQGCFIDIHILCSQVLLDRHRVHRQTVPTDHNLVYCNLGKHTAVNSASTNKIG